MEVWQPDSDQTFLNTRKTLVSNLGANDRLGTLMNLLHLCFPSISHGITSPTHVSSSTELADECFCCWMEWVHYMMPSVFHR